MADMSATKNEAPLRSLRILHVLTLNGASGEYGGPNRVAHELCVNLQNRGHRVQIFTGALPSSVPQFNQEFEESFELVRPLSKHFPVSSLWSRKLPKRIFQIVKDVDLVHIHFARDLIPVLTAFICTLMGKPFVTQTHGMVIQDSRFLIKVVDLIFTRVALNRSAVNFVLSEQELSDLNSFHFKSQMNLLPNGIQVSEAFSTKSENKTPKIVFCSRLQARKRPDRFLNLARYAAKHDLSASFTIFGPDGGELADIENEINSDRYLSAVKYKGALPPSQVLEMLRGSDLLVLPSEDEPFPMIVLEALSVGTPVLIMPSCGLASFLKLNYPKMVAAEDDEAALLTAFTDFYGEMITAEDREEIRDFCKEMFSIDRVTTTLEFNYQAVVNH